jgi:hypothetical protein
MDGTLKPQKITNLEKLKDTIHSDKSFEKNMDKSALECKCCGSMAPILGNVDFAKTCTDRLGVAVFENTGCLVPYHKCSKCGFIFTTFADEWSDNTISEMIYNEEYGKADGVMPGWEAGKNDPRQTISYKTGVKLINNFGIASDQGLKLLDYGAGGNPGPTGLCFEDKGFDLTSYEPYLCDGASQLKHEKYDLIYSIEVFEHVINLTDLTNFMAHHLSDRGLMYVQTMIHPHPSEEDILGSWYIAPRNGHFSIFTFPAIFLLFKRVGINIVQTPLGMVGFKNKPLFKNNIFI